MPTKQIAQELIDKSTGILERVIVAELLGITENNCISHEDAIGQVRDLAERLRTK